MHETGRETERQTEGDGRDTRGERKLGGRTGAESEEGDVMDL